MRTCDKKKKRGVIRQRTGGLEYHGDAFLKALCGEKRRIVAGDAQSKETHGFEKREKSREGPRPAEYILYKKADLCLERRGCRVNNKPCAFDVFLKKVKVSHQKKRKKTRLSNLKI